MGLPCPLALRPAWDQVVVRILTGDLRRTAHVEVLAARLPTEVVCTHCSPSASDELPGTERSYDRRVEIGIIVALVAVLASASTFA